MKRILILVMSAILVLSILVGCNNDVKERNKTLTMWNMVFGNDDSVSDKNLFHKAIKSFENDFPEVELIIKDFEVQAGFGQNDDFYKKLATECMAGTGPDVIYADSQFTIVNDLYKMQAAGAFADLTEFIENDKEFNKDDYVMPVIDGVKYNGKQYVMPLTYQMPVIYSPKETFEKEGFNAENFNNAEGILNEFIAFRERNPDNGKMLFTSGLFFSHFYHYMGLNIIDNYNQKANLDNEFFKKTLEFWKDNHKHESMDVQGHFYHNTVLEFFPDKNVALGSNVMSFDTYFSTLRNSTIIANESVMLPWRDENGGIPVQLSTAIMINGKSENKQNAWEFIKRVLISQADITPENGWFDGSLPISGIPTNKKAWASYFKVWTIEYDGINHKIDNSKPLQQVDLDNFATLQEQISSIYIRYPNDREIYNSFVPYFEGKKTYDECKQEAQQKIEIYLSE